jgi:hypothetical protein
LYKERYPKKYEGFKQKFKELFIWNYQFY